jgi:crotonobetainyl-CoA:carnitine CoA-transferase CaiB-like acyl-CoA transferase
MNPGMSTSTAVPGAPLAGVKVVEMATWMAAPSAAVILSDLGAEVVKIEPPGGDRMRGMVRPARLEGRETVDEGFQADNRGKRSMIVAVDRPEGALVVQRLAAASDVFLCNMLPHRQERYGLDPATLFELQPRLVHATLTGYGTEGPEASRPGYDVTAFFGRSGLSESLVEGDGPPPHPRPAQGDHTTGLAMVVAILSALRMAEQTGQGQVAEVSLLHTAAWTMNSDLAAPLVDGKQPSSRDRFHLFAPLANRYPCGDGRWIVLNMPETRWWPVFCKAVDHPEWCDDERFGTVKDRFDHMPELVAMIDDALSARGRDEWGRIFDEHGMIWGPVQTFAELADDPQASAAGLWAEIDHPVAGPFRTVAVPVKVRDARIGPQGPAPGPGQHTREVLAGLGYDEGEVEALIEAGVVHSA